MTEREQLIDKLSDLMDRDNATAFVDRVIADAFKAGFAWCANGTDKHGEYNGGSIADGLAEWLATR